MSEEEQGMMVYKARDTEQEALQQTARQTANSKQTVGESLDCTEKRREVKEHELRNGKEDRKEQVHTRTKGKGRGGGKCSTSFYLWAAAEVELEG